MQVSSSLFREPTLNSREGVIVHAPPESSEFLRIDVLEGASTAPNVLRSLNFSQLASGLIV